MNGDDTREFEVWDKLRPLDSVALETLLTDPDELIRRTAARELQMRGERKTLDRGVELCSSDDPGVRATAAFLLGQLGTPNFPFAGESIPRLTVLLRGDPDAGVRAASASSLGHLRAVDAVTELLEATNDPESDVRAEVAFALGKIASLQAVDGLLRLARDQDADVRSWAAQGLGHCEGVGQEVVATLRDLERDPDFDVREEAQEALRLVMSRR